MKRILALLLCLVLLLCGMTACKPDNITYPSEITDPDENSEDTPVVGKPTDEGETEPEKEPVEDTPATEAPAPEQTSAHPFAAPGFTPSTGITGVLPIGGFIKNVTPAEALKDRTIALYTAREEAAFNYVNQKGATVSEWDWMKELAAEHGFTVKISVKSADLSLKSQRVALLSGKALSVLQLRNEDLAQGMTLARSAGEMLDKGIATFGISQAVLTQSNDTLFAPVGYADTLWYNPALMPAETDPFTLANENNWTLDAFKGVYENAAANAVDPLQMSDTLAWATLSGKSPLTLAKGELDHNLYAKDTRDAFEQIREICTNLPVFTPAADTTYNLKFGNTAMAYTALPERGEKATLNYAPLPALEEGTPGTVTFSGTFMALPKYTADAQGDAAALAFIELWCNRFTEARAGALMELGMTANDYVNYAAFTEENGMLVFHSPEIETLAATYLSGLTDSEVDMEDEYDDIKTELTALITRHNLYY